MDIVLSNFTDRLAVDTGASSGIPGIDDDRNELRFSMEVDDALAQRIESYAQAWRAVDAHMSEYQSRLRSCLGRIPDFVRADCWASFEMTMEMPESFVKTVSDRIGVNRANHLKVVLVRLMEDGRFLAFLHDGPRELPHSVNIEFFMTLGR